MKRSMGEIPAWMRNSAVGVAGMVGVAAVVSHEMNRPLPEKTEERAPDPLTELEKARQILEHVARVPRRESTERIDERLKEMSHAIDLTYYQNPNVEMIRQIDRYLAVLLFQPLTDKDRRYSTKTIAEVVAELEPTITSVTMSSATRSVARDILKGRLHQELIRMTRQMSPEDIVSHRVFLGLDIHAPNRPTGADMDEMWKYKIQTRAISSEAVKTYGPSTRESLKDKTERITLDTWIKKQQAATDWFSRHAGELGFDTEIAPYLSPETMLAVVHAEHFSVFDAETFIELSPVLFETFNIPFMPSVHDNLYSGGLNQTTEATFKGIVEKYGDTLREIQTVDPSISFIIPDVEKATKDTGEVSQAMVTDLDSQTVYNILILAENMKRTTRLIQNGEPLHDVWQSADTASRARFIATLAPAATNRPAHAKKMVIALARPHVSLDQISAQMAALGEKDGADTADRGANRGYQTAQFFFKQTL